MLFASPCTRLAHRLPLFVLGCVLAVLAAGCGGSNHNVDAGPSPSRPLPARSSADPPGSADPLAATPRDIAAAQEKYYRAYIAAMVDPGDQARVDELLTSYTLTGKPRASVAAWMKALAKRGYAGRPGPGNHYVIEKIDLSGPDAVVATVCGYDDGVIFDARQRAPDGSEIVVDDIPISERTLVTWVKHGTWQIDDARTTDSWKGKDGCPPSKPS